MTPTQKELLAEVERRVADSIMEPGTAELMRKLIVQADNDDEAIKVMQLGTTYKRTGLHFDHRLERSTSDIHYLRRNEALSFHTDDSKPVHRLIIGDNYPALQNLLVQYRSKVDVIYIDPPYGKDSMGEFAKTNYENALTRDNLLSMLWPRLQLAKMLLSDHGVIFCSIDDRNQAYVKCLFDEVFGERNFIATIIWERAYAPVNLKKHFSESHDYILCFAKNIDEAVCNGLPRTDGANSKYKNPDNDPRGLWRTDNLAVGPRVESQVYEITTPSGRKVLPPDGYCWRLSKERFDEYVKDNRIWFGENGNLVPAPKRFLSEVKDAMTPMTIWKYDEVGHSQDAMRLLRDVFGGKVLFNYPKSVPLISRLIHLYSQPDSIILDFFAGSGTTGHAVLELNRQEAEAGNLLKERKPEGRRQFILVQLDEKTDTTPGGIARDVTAERLRRIMTGKASDGSSDFDWLKKHRPYGGNLEVLELATVADFEHTEGKTPADVIDETLYGLPPFTHLRDKMDWLCANFPQTQKSLD